MTPTADPSGADEGGEVMLARAVPRRGRSRAWIDGRMATVGALAEAAGGLVELHGQHQHQSLVCTPTPSAGPSTPSARST